MSTLLDKVVRLHEVLDGAGLPHAVGGALALAFHVREPRATRDIDLNVFVDTDQLDAVLGGLPEEVVVTDDDRVLLARDGQARLFWDETPVDVFLAVHEFHRWAARRTPTVPLGGTTVPILDATALTVFKAFFDRTKDWADIEEMLWADAVDVQAALGWLVDLLGADDARVSRLADLDDALVDEEGGDGGDPRFDP